MYDIDSCSTTVALVQNEDNGKPFLQGREQHFGSFG